jgi:S1-C subfamily serine protease
VQLCEDTGIVVTTGEPTGVGETVTSGVLPVVVHPLKRIMTPMVTRRVNKSQDLFRAIVSDISSRFDKYLVE